MSISQLSGVIAFFYGCSSSYLLCTVSLSRCYIIMRPFHANEVTIEKSVCISSIVVFISFIWSILPIIGWNEYTLKGTRASCCINWYDRRLSYVSFTFFLFFVVYLIPLLIFIATNTVTLIGFKRMRDKARHGIRTIIAAKRVEVEQSIVKTFRSKHYAIPPLATLMCASFVKTSTIWVPLLYMSTSTQSLLRFVNHSRKSSRRRPEHGIDKIARKYGLIQNNHDLNPIRRNDETVASYLDPESHRQLSPEDKQAAKAILPNFMKKESQFIGSSSTSTYSTGNKRNQTLTDKLRIMLGMSTNVKQTRTLSADDELVLFTQLIRSYKSNFSTFWTQYRERFPCLYRVVQRVNIIAVTSVPSESIFLVAGYVTRKQRTSLSSTSLRHLIVLKESYRLEELQTISRRSMN
ncbi:unnamed protein product [Rotaria magnacalcarata]|uniref:G-protein coupled receptors family 1 profile domain-containing protein n=3 Tax=Rotaria magnacalcarata TaxID=392030 RepID=A0A816XFV0_9BILA|nr:unnamed protein product [Rotaria magnacalcarata]